MDPIAPHHINEAGLREYLRAHQWPTGMQDAVLKSLNRIPMRYFIVDDSGSMAVSDGHRLVNNKMVNCTRWSELVCGMKFHAGLAQASGAVSEFRLLNAAVPCLVGCQDGGEGYRMLMRALDGTPGGKTPLCRHINEITAQIRSMETQIRQAGHKVVVVIATDGESTDGDILTALKPLENLPVQIVIRLCTDEDNIVNYWNDIDNQLEAEIDVLDDLAGEAEEVCSNNKWLTYGEPMHKLREFGIDIKEFDLLDQSKLSLEQIRVVCATLFGGRPDDYPHPEADAKAFMKYLHVKNQESGLVYSPTKKAMRPWIEEGVLQSQYYGSCTVM
jgi:hypothetical protein